MQPFLRYCILILIGAVAAACALVYIANTVLYLTPPNPLKAMLLPTIMRIEAPLFAQNWHLFAPRPIDRNYVIEVRCRYAGRATVLTAWRDITTPFLVRHHETRISPMGNLLRVQQSALRYVMNQRPDDWAVLFCRKAGRLTPDCYASQWTRKMQADGFLILDRIASRECDRALGLGRTSFVQFRVLVEYPPVWSKRDQPGVSKVDVFMYPWLPYQAFPYMETRT